MTIATNTTIKPGTQFSVHNHYTDTYEQLEVVAVSVNGMYVAPAAALRRGVSPALCAWYMPADSTVAPKP